MANCKDCIHFDVCTYNQYVFAHFTGEITKKLIYIGNNSACLLFKDRNRFVELPCKVGDKVYYFHSDNNYEKYEVCEIVGFHIDKYRTAFQIELCGYKCFVDTEFLGERIFLTREEAERALEEWRSK